MISEAPDWRPPSAQIEPDKEKKKAAEGIEDQLIANLAKLPPGIQFAQERNRLAKQFKVNNSDIEAEVKAYREDAEAVAATLELLEKRQEALKSNPNPDDSALPPDGQAFFDGVSFWFRGADDADFDSLIARARAVPLQWADVIEIMELKAMSALRAGRHDAGVRMLEEACASAEKDAQVVLPRLRRRLEQVAARAAS